MRRWSAVAGVLGLAVVACGGGSETRDRATPEASTTTLAPHLEIVEDLVYREGSDPSLDGWRPPLVDVYAPTGADDLPVVVMFHGNPQAVDKEYLRGLAMATAKAGAVVFVPNWGATSMPVAPAEVLERGLRLDDAAACAVSYAIEHAVEYGGDARQLVFAGHSAGANMAAVTGLRPAGPFPGCVVDPVTFEPDGLVLWEGDWLLALQYPWDQFSTGLPTIMPYITPWEWLDQAARPNIDLVATAGGQESLQRCDASLTSGWYAWRDPGGRFADLIERFGAFDDGCFHPGEANEILAEAMREEGFEVEEIFLPNSVHEVLGEDDTKTMVDAILTVGEGHTSSSE